MSKTTYVWDEVSDNVIEEYEDGILSVSYTHEPGLYGNLLSQHRNSVTSYYHFDGRGDTVALTDDSGNITDTKEYDAWGNVIMAAGNSDTTYWFQGRRGMSRDPVTQLLMRRSMPYQPSTGRWLRRSASTFRWASTYAATSFVDEDPDENVGLYYVLQVESYPTAPEKLPCGGFKQYFKWKLPAAAERKLKEPGMAGLIVQKVTSTQKVSHCDGTEISYPFKNSRGDSLSGPPETFWEAWTVRWSNDKMDVVMEPERTEESQKNEVTFTYNDLNKAQNFGPGTKGSQGYDFEMILMIGPKAQMALPPDFRIDPNHPAGEVPHSSVEPRGWESAELRLIRSLHASWNCCPCDPEKHHTKMTTVNQGTVQRRNDDKTVEDPPPKGM